MKKTCRKCKKEKGLDLFVKNKDCRDGYAHICLDCYRKFTNMTKEERELFEREKQHRKEERLRKKKEKSDLFKIKQEKLNEVKLQKQKVHEQIKVEKEKLFKEGKKLCKYCHKIKPLDIFLKQKSCKDGHTHMCYTCSRKRYYEPKKEQYTLAAIKWQRENPHKIKEHRKTFYNKPESKIKNSIKQRILDILKYKKERFNIYIGCTCKQLKSHLESQFTKEMNWNNYGNCWVIDHIVPCAAFDLSDKDEILWCWNYKNLRPLSKADNEKKWDLFSNGKSVRDLRRDSPSEIDNLKYKMLMDLGVIQFQY